MSRVSLYPHPSLDRNLSKDFSVQASALASADTLKLQFWIEGPAEALAQIECATTVDSKQTLRKNELWKETCFECFIPVRSKSDAYFEFNGSTAGDWNLYSFDTYREGMKEVPLSIQPVLRLEKKDISIHAEWTLPMQFSDELDLKCLGITLVLKTKKGTTYWAVRHGSEKPDFHLRTNFIYDSIRN